MARYLSNFIAADFHKVPFAHTRAALYKFLNENTSSGVFGTVSSDRRLSSRRRFSRRSRRLTRWERFKGFPPFVNQQ